MYNPDLPAPELGVFYDLPFEKYQEINATSTSEILKFRAPTPAHARVELAKNKKTDSLILGSLVDHLIQPNNPSRLPYAFVPPGTSFATTAGKKLRDELIFEGYAKEEILKGDELDKAKTMVERLNAVKRFTGLVERATAWQVSIVWKNQFGYRRARFDLLTEELEAQVIVDVKTAAYQYLNHFKSQQQFWEHGYFTKAAAYLEAAYHADFDVQDFIIAAVESDEPFATRVESLEPQSIAIGKIELEELERMASYCIANNDFRAYAEGDRFSAPKWAKERYLPSEDLGSTKRNVERVSADDLIEELAQ